MKKLMTTVTALTGNQVAVYIDDMPDPKLHATKDVDTAMEKGGGKYLVTDECEARGGFPVINGVKVKVYGAGEGWVYLSNYAMENDIRYIVAEGTYKVPDGGSVSVSHTKLTAAGIAAYRQANELFMALV